MRRFLVGDASGYQWKRHCDLKIEKKHILLLQYARIGDFNGRKLSSIDDSIVTINPPSEYPKKLHQSVSNILKWKPLEILA